MKSDQAAPSIRTAILAIGAGLVLASAPADAAIAPLPGTPGNTALVDALLKATPDFNAGDYTLGMSADDAVAKLKAGGLLNHRYAQPEIGFKFRQMPDHPLNGGAFGLIQRPDGATPELVSLAFTMYPNKPVVASIARTLSYNPSEAPNVANTIAALRKKYGPEIGTLYQNRLHWLFDYKGHPLSAADLAQLEKAGCADGGPGGGGPTDGGIATGGSSIINKDFLGRKIGNGYVESYGGRNNQTPGTPTPAICFEVIHIDAWIVPAQPGTGGAWGQHVYVNKGGNWSSVGEALVTQLTVTIKNVALDYAASAVTRNAVLNGGKQQEQRQLESAKKKAPKL